MFTEQGDLVTNLRVEAAYSDYTDSFYSKDDDLQDIINQARSGALNPTFDALYRSGRNAVRNQDQFLSEFVFFELEVLNAPVNTPPSIYATDPNDLQMNFNEHTITPLTNDLLYAYDKETEYSSDIQYEIIGDNYSRSSLNENQFSFGHIANTNSMYQPITSFSQYDIDSFHIVFVPPKSSKSVNWPQNLKLKLSDSMGASNPTEVDVQFNLRPSVTWAPAVKQNRGISLFRGRSQSICRDQLEFFHHNTTLTLQYINGLKYGKLIYLSKPVDRNTQIKYSDIEKDANCGNLVYQHDGSENTHSDNIVFKASDTSGNEIIFLVSIEVIKKDDSPPILVKNIEKTIVMGETLNFDKSFLQAKDPDSADSSIKFTLLNELNYGNLINYDTKSNCTQWKQFTTCNGGIYYESTRHINQPVQENFEFTLSDSRGNTNENIKYTFTINILPKDEFSPEKCVQNFEPISVTGPGATDITKNHLCYYDDFSSNKEIRIQTTNNCRGSFYSKITNKNVTEFNQDEIDYNKILYIADHRRFNSERCPINLRVCDKPAPNSGDRPNCKIDRIYITINPINIAEPRVTSQTLVSKNGKPANINRNSIIVTDSDSLIEEISIEVTKYPNFGRIVPRSLNYNVNNLSNAWPHPITLKEIKSNLLQYQPFKKYAETFNQDLVSTRAPGVAQLQDRPIKDDFVIKVTDGKNEIYETINIEFQWDEIPNKENLKDFKLNCEENESVLISPEHLKSDNLDLIYELDEQPSKGRLVNRATQQDVDVFSFTQRQVNEEVIFYLHDPGVDIGITIDTDVFSLRIDNVKNLPIVITIDILPVDDDPPVITNPVLQIIAQEGNPAYLPVINIEDIDTPLSEVYCTITKQPNHGIIDNISPAPGSEMSRQDIPISMFTAKDSKDKLLRYNPLDKHGYRSEPVSDDMKFSCEDQAGNQALNAPFTINIEIQPTNDETPELQTKPITVNEGDSKAITTQTVICTDADRYGARASSASQDELFIIFEELPYNGKIILANNQSAQSGSSLNFQGFAVRPTQPPNFETQNPGSYSQNDEDDSDYQDLSFNSYPSYEEEEYEDNYAYDENYVNYDGYEPLPFQRMRRTQNQFRYAQINVPIPYADFANNLVYYLHNSKEEFDDKFKIKCQDSEEHMSSSKNIQIKIISVNDETPRMTKNGGLFIKTGEKRDILNTVLQATDKDTKDSDIIYMISTLPDYGYLFKNFGDQAIRLQSQMNFTQDDIDKGLISYQHDPTIRKEGDQKKMNLQKDFFKFDLYDGKNRNSNKYFWVQIKGRDRIYPEVVNRGLTLPEGGRVAITTDLLSTNDINSADLDLTFNVLKEPKYGKLVNTDDQAKSIDSFTQLELVGNKIFYIHTDKNEKRHDTFEFSVSDGYNYLHRTFKIKIVNVDNKVPLIETTADIRCNEGEMVEITPYEINISDGDTSLNKIMMQISKQPFYGKIKLAGRVASAFSMQDIADKLVTYEHSGLEKYQDNFEFKITDGTHQEYYKENEITNKPVRIDIRIAKKDNKFPILKYNHPIKTLSEVDNSRSIGSLINRYNLDSFDEDTDPENIIYKVTQEPNEGYIAINHGVDGLLATTSFTQEDINNDKVYYRMDLSKIDSDVC